MTTMWEKLLRQDDGFMLRLGEKRKSDLECEWSKMFKESKVECHYGEQKSAWKAVETLLARQL